MASNSAARADLENENRLLRSELAAARVALAELRERFTLLEGSTVDPDPRPVLREVAALRRRVQDLEAEQVQAALARGFSYAEIAAELGVTRQAVHQRYPRSGGSSGTEIR